MQKEGINQPESGIRLTNWGLMSDLRGEWHSSLKVYRASLSFKRY